MHKQQNSRNKIRNAVSREIKKEIRTNAEYEGQEINLFLAKKIC